MRKSNFALRLQPSLLEEARKLAEAEGVALNQLINVAVAEKLSALRTADYFTARAARADIPKALKILKRAGVGKPPTKGDELPPKKREQNAKRHDDADGVGRRNFTAGPSHSETSNLIASEAKLGHFFLAGHSQGGSLMARPARRS